MSSVAASILETFEKVLGTSLPLRVRGWDGSEAGPPHAQATVVFRNKRALRRIVYAPGELGLARAFVSGDLALEGDIFDLLDLPDLIERVSRHEVRGVDRKALRWGVRRALRLGAVGLPPKPPAMEIRSRRGGRHSEARDSASVSSHYDIGNEFYRLLLGPSMVYSCAYFAGGSYGGDGAATLEDAQWAKCEHICRKLGVGPGARLLDVGCGWGTMAIHAAREHGASAVGVTLSREQLRLARERAEEAGVADQVEFRLQDYREIDDGPFDAICSIGMAEHVGRRNLPIYAADLYRLLPDGGRLLNHQISSVRPLPQHLAHGTESGRRRGARTFIDRYVFPDGEILPLSITVDALERGGFEVRDVESLREHYGVTLRAWVDNLYGSWDEAVRLIGAEHARVWLLYLAASALGFEYPHRLGLNQTLAVKPDAGGGSGMPMTRAGLYR